ncbi:MAG TPA: cyclic nucleotide-binding domain-containing protein [Anaerolineaceae bacterium]
MMKLNGIDERKLNMRVIFSKGVCQGMSAAMDPLSARNERRSLNTHELTIRYGIPREELDAFQAFLRIYPYDHIIIREGDTDKSLYLVRVGAVGIYRQVGQQQEKIATIEAVNFVGEMSLINAEPRSATVKADSDVTIVYAIANPSLPLILAKPKWAELLVSRLCKNLAENNTQIVAASATIKRQQEDIATLQSLLEKERAEKRGLLAQAEQALNAILNFQDIVRDTAVVGSRGWAYLKALGDMTRSLAAHYLPEAQIAGNKANLRVMKRCLAAIRKNNPGTILADLTPREGE